jgi:hypothetical protein
MQVVVTGNGVWGGRPALQGGEAEPRSGRSPEVPGGTT